MTEAPAEHSYEVVASRTVYNGAILALRVDELTMPGGRTAEREIVEHLSAVTILARDEQGRIALVRQYRHPVQRRLLELPAGLIDSVDGVEEDPLTAARRELLEEADLVADSWRLLTDIDLSPGFTDEAVRIYLAEDLHAADGGEREHEEAEMTVSWVSLEEAVAMVFAGEITDASSVVGILALLAADRGAELRPVDAPWKHRPTALHRRQNR